MTYPTVFFNLAGGTQSAALLDTMFNVCGNQGNIACTAAGTNTITLTPQTNFFLPAAYVNFQMVTFAAAATSTNPVTIQIGALAFVKLFNPNGVQAKANDLTSGTLYTACFQSTLDTGAGGFQILNSPGSLVTSVPSPQGYLTPVTLTPIILTDATAITSIFYTPYNGQLVPIYNGTNMVASVFAELTLALSNTLQAASNIYDVFVFLNSGVVTVGFGPTWTAGAGAGNITPGSCARGTGAGSTALARIQGILTNGVSITLNNGASTFSVGANLATYVGSVWVDTVAGQVSCHRTFGQSRKFGIWNCYNRNPIILQAGDATASWNYSTNTFRPSNNAAANNLSAFTGLAEEIADVRFEQIVRSSVAAQNISGTAPGVGIGLNSTVAATGYNPQPGVWNLTLSGAITATSNQDSLITARLLQPPSLGINTFQSLERSTNTSSTTAWNGTAANMLLSGVYRG